MSACRCGHTGDGAHPCHRCHNADGTERFVTTGRAPVAGVQFKLSAYRTWACDDCWAEYRRERRQEAGES